MLKEEVCTDQVFNIYEKRLPEQKLPTANITGQTNVPWYTTVTVSGGVITAVTAAAADITFTIGTQYAVCLGPLSGFTGPQAVFRIGHMIRIRATDTAGNPQDVIGVVNAINTETASTAPSTIGFIATKTVPVAVDYDLAGNIGVDCLVIGSAYGEGSLNTSTGIYNLPTQVANYVGISRSPFSITGSALKTSAKYDETGPYKDQAKEMSVYHMIELEKTFLFSSQSKVVGATGLPTYTSGGILWFLAQWELTSGNPYAPFGGATLDSDDNKRIITNVNGLMSDKLYNTYLERLFRVTNNKANEKLVLCGSGFLNVINQLYMSRGCLDSSMPITETYGMNVVKHQTPFGVIYYKTHPLMSQNASLRNNAFFLDIQNFVYRYLDGRDTALLKNRQPNDADYRTDEWLTEAGLELRFPESHMYIQNVLDYAP